MVAVASSAQTCPSDEKTVQKHARIKAVATGEGKRRGPGPGLVGLVHEDYPESNLGNKRRSRSRPGLAEEGE